MLTLRLLLKIRFALKINTNEMIPTLNNDERDIISISHIYIVFVLFKRAFLDHIRNRSYFLYFFYSRDDIRTNLNTIRKFKT